MVRIKGNSSSARDRFSNKRYGIISCTVFVVVVSECECFENSITKIFSSWQFVQIFELQEFMFLLLFVCCPICFRFSWKMFFFAQRIRITYRKLSLLLDYRMWMRKVLLLPYVVFECLIYVNSNIQHLNVLNC